MKLRIITLFLIVAMIFTGCTKIKDTVVPEEPNTNTTTPSKEKSSYFGVAYYPNENINPVLSHSKINYTLNQLLYEGLFVLDENYNPQNLLCKEYTGDGINFTFTLKEGVKFWSGEPLTAADVVYTYQKAMVEGNDLYKGRLSNIKQVKAEGDNVVKITLNTPNTQFPALLDIPIFRKGTESEHFSDGTGIYMPISVEGKTQLQRFEGWHGQKVPEFETITLINTIRSDTISSSFETGDISITQAPRISATPVSIKGAVEVHSLPTTNIHYLGVNHAKYPYNVPQVRQALSYMLSRDEIVRTSLQGFGDGALLPINPQPKDIITEDMMEKNQEKAIELLISVGITDSNNDGLLDYMTDSGKREPFSPTVLVNNDNTFKSAVLEKYKEELKLIGINLQINYVSYEEYTKGLVNKQFDLYYGSTTMSTDFNMSPLFGAGGGLNYGGYANADMDNLIYAFKSQNGTGKTEAQKNLYNKFTEQMPIIPIAFERTQVFVRNGLAGGIKPMPNNIFYGIQNWTR